MGGIFKSFSPQRRVRTDDGSVSGDSTLTGPMPGEIVRLLKDNSFRADIRLYSGTPLSGVRLPGPRYDKRGRLHGIKPGYRQGQMVLVEYAGGAASPVVTQVYPFAAADIEKGNLKQADYDPDTVEIGHFSGHRAVWEKDRFSFVGGDPEQDAIVIDFKKKLIELQAEQLLLFGDTLQLGNGAVLGAAYGAPIHAYLQSVHSYLMQVGAFLQTVIPGTGAAAAWTGGTPPPPPDENTVVSESTKII